MALRAGASYCPAQSRRACCGSLPRGLCVFASTYLSVSNLIYGSVAAIMAILTWAYLSGLIFLFGAYLSVCYFQRRHKSRQPQMSAGLTGSGLQ